MRTNVRLTISDCDVEISGSAFRPELYDSAKDMRLEVNFPFSSRRSIERVWLKRSTISM